MGVKAEEDENRVIADRVYIGDVSVAGMTEEEAAQAEETVNQMFAKDGETYQEIAGRMVRFDDREAVRAALAEGL